MNDGRSEPRQALLFARLYALRGRFVERARGERDAIFLAATRGEDAKVREHAHRLAGTAGSFGHEEVGNAARQVCELIERGAPRGEIDQATQQMLATLDKLAPATVTESSD